MLIVSILSTVTVLVSAADYTLPAPSPPGKYASKKPAVVPVLKASDIALIAKLVEQLQGYDPSLPGPAYVGDGALTEQSYPETDLSPLLKLLYRGKPKKHGLTATVKYLNPLPGLYGDPSYGIDNSHLTAAYKRPALGLSLLHALASPANLLYQHPSPAYPMHFGPGHRLPLSPAGIFGYSGYGPLPASVAPIPVIIITKKKHVDEEEYDADAAAITEAPAPAPADYVLKPKKPVIKVVVPAKKTPASASYASAKVKVLPKPIKAKVYSKTANVKPVVVLNKAKNYKKVVKVTVPAEAAKTSYSPMTIKATKPYTTTEKTIAAVEVSAPIPVVPKYTAVPTLAPVPAVPKYTAVPTVAPAPLAPVAVVKPADDAQSSPDSAEVAAAASIAEPDAGESARASLPETKISSQRTISRIS